MSFTSIVKNEVSKLEAIETENIAELSALIRNIGNYKNKSIKIKDVDTLIDFSQKGLKKTFNIKQSNETLQTAPVLSDIIKESVYVNSSIDLDDENFVYHYFYSPITINGTNAISMITIKEIVTDKSSNPKFYYHDIREINNEELLHAIPQQKLSKMLFEETPNINNSISQNNKFVKNDIAINKDMQNVKDNTNIIKSIENFKNAKNNVDRQTVIDIANNLEIKQKTGANVITNTEISKKAEKNKNPEIVTITETFEELTSKNIKEYRKNAKNIALKLFRDVVVKIYDTKTMAEINKSGIDKTFSGAVTKSKIQTADNLKDIIQQGIYGYTTYNKNDMNKIMYHHFFTPVNYENNNGLVRVVIKEFTKDKTMRDRFYYHQLEFISNKKIKGLDTLPQNLETRNFKSSPNINNSITQNNKFVKNDTAINKDMQNIQNNTKKNRNVFTQQIQEYKGKSYLSNVIKGNVVVINTNILDGISKKKQNSFMNEYLRTKVKGHDYYVDSQKIIANKHTIGKLMHGTTNYDSRIDKSIKTELKANVIGNLSNIIKNSKAYQVDLPDTKNHTFADYFDRRKSIFNYNGQNYIVMFTVGKKKGINTLYSIENIKKTSNSLSKDTNVPQLPKKGNDPTVLNNSIPKTKRNVNSMKKGNTTQNDDIRYLKKKALSSKQNNTFKNKNNSNQQLIHPKDKIIQNRISKEQVQIQKELHKRIENAILSKNSRKNTFLGNVAQKVVSKVKELYGIDISERKHIIADYDIRHIIKQHGNPEIEKAKGQIAVTTKDIEKIPDIINTYDNITTGNDNKQGKTIRYIKEYSNNKMYVVEVIPNANNKSLYIKTMWIKPVTLTNSQKTPSSTSKTRGNSSSSTSNNNISQNNKTVKNDDNIRFLKNEKNSQNEKIKKSLETKINNKKSLTNAERTDAYIEQEIRKIEESGNWDNSIPVTSRTDIRKTIEDYLGLGIKKGHFRQSAFGIYKSNRDVIRVKEYKDMDTILHETGHALDLTNRLNIDKESIANELLTAIDKLGGYENETRTIKLEEGFAEVIREYSIIPWQAKKDYPQTIKVLEKIRKNDKSFDKFIEKVQEQTYNYIHQNPQNRVHSNLSIGERTDKIPMSKEWLKKEVVKAVYDTDYILKDTVKELAKANKKTVNEIKASDNAYYLTRLMNGIGDKVTSMLADGYIDENNKQLTPGLNKVGEILGDAPQRYNDLRDYLVANRDAEYKDKDLKTGIRTKDSKYVLEKFENDIQIKEAGQVIYDTLDGVLQYAVNNGLITQETMDNLKESNTFYVPMQRVLENRGNQVGKRGAVQSIIKQRTGSELDVKDVLENIVSNSANIIQQVENNNVLKALYKQGEESGLTGAVYDVIDTPMVKIGNAKLSTWEIELKKQGVDTTKLDLEKTIDLFAPNNKIDERNLITSFINDDGNRVYLQFNDEMLFKTLSNLDRKSVSKILKISSWLNMPLRYGATMANVGFAIPNMISDTVQASVYSTAGFIPVVDNALGVLDVLTATNSTVKRFMNSVAPDYVTRISKMYNIYQQTGSTNSSRLSQYRDSTQQEMKNIYGTKNSKILGINEKFKPLKRLLDILTYIPEISEQSTRFRVFERNYKYYKNKGNSEVDARILAALEARDATQDFSRGGYLTREVNQFIPFSSARVGGVYTFVEKVSANPRTVGMKIAILTVLALAIKGMGYDDKEIEELNQRKKDDNFVLKVGDSIVTIKKPQGILRTKINLAEYIMDLATGHIDEGKEGERLSSWLHNAIMDNMPADSITGLVPNSVQPLIENAINKDLYYNTDIVKSYDLDLPNSEQYYDNYSPAKIDNLISGYFAGLGTQFTNGIDYVSGKLGLSTEKPKMGAESNTITKRFIVNVNSNSASLDEIYNLKTELTKKLNGDGLSEKEEQQLEKVKSAVSYISKINKQIKGIKADLTLSGKEKADKIKILQEQRTDVARQALDKELIHNDNSSDIKKLEFYPSNSYLSLNNYKLDLTDDMKSEYAQIASQLYNKYDSQGLYSKESLEKIKSKITDYSKKTLMSKYRSQLVKIK